jgi:aubergine-like protein
LIKYKKFQNIRCDVIFASPQYFSNYKLNFKLLFQDLAQHTKLSPFQRLAGYKNFLERVNGNEQAKRLLDDWGLKLDKQPVKVTARVLEDERIIFGNGKSYDIGPNADFGRQITSNTVFEAHDLTNWILIFDKRDKQAAESFENLIHKVSGPTGMKTTKGEKIIRNF